MKILSVCGARPNFMKIAPLARSFSARRELSHIIVHTGQHYDALMDRCFFDDLGIPRPDVNLEVGSQSHAVQTARVMERFEPVLIEQRPDCVLVVGDVNSTIACALVAAKLGTPVVHVEAGLRSFDRGMPEEINRVLTDALSDLLFVTESSGVENLRREGIASEKVHLVGNVMIDTLRAHAERAATSPILQQLELTPRRYAVVTLHRPANVDDPEHVRALMNALIALSHRLPLVFPVHPRTRGNLKRHGALATTTDTSNLRLIEPLGYLDFLRLMSQSAIVITDSGGIQEETTVLGVPCLTLRDNTERPVTVTQGTNRLIGTNPSRIVAEVDTTLQHPPTGRVPELWDGRAAERITDVLLSWRRTSN